MSKIKYFLQQSWLLIGASFCFGLLIAVTNAALDPIIKQNEKDKLNRLMTQLISDANSFQIVIEGLRVEDTKGKITPTNIYQALDSNGKQAGFAFVAVGMGFADKIKLVIAVDGQFEKVLGFKVLSSNETPGFGSRMADDAFDNPLDFVDQFKQAPVGQLVLVRTGSPEMIRTIDNQIVAISGATISSEAVIRIFNRYIGRIKKQLQVEGLIAHGQ